MFTSSGHGRPAPVAAEWLKRDPAPTLVCLRGYVCGGCDDGAVIVAAEQAVANGWLFGPLIGVLGTGVGVLLTGRLDRLRWRRDWMSTQIRERMKFAADACRAVDGQMLMLGQAADAAAGNRKPVDEARVTAADAAWRDVLTTRYVYADADLQRALSAFDLAREAAVLAVIAAKPHGMALAAQRLEAVRLQVMDAVQGLANEANEALGHHSAPLLARVGSRLRGRPLGPVAPKPSEVAESETVAA